MNVPWWAYLIVAGVCLVIAIGTYVLNVAVVAKHSEDGDQSFGLSMLCYGLGFVVLVCTYRAGEVIDLWASLK